MALYVVQHGLYEGGERYNIGDFIELDDKRAKALGKEFVRRATKEEEAEYKKGNPVHRAVLEADKGE